MLFVFLLCTNRFACVFMVHVTLFAVIHIHSSLDRPVVANKCCYLRNQIDDTYSFRGQNGTGSVTQQ